MSVLANYQAMPSKMLGLLRLVAALPNQAATRQDLHDLWWPRSNRPEKLTVDFFGDNVRELRAVGLLDEVEEDGESLYRLGATIPSHARSPEGLVGYGVELFTAHLFREKRSSSDIDPSTLAAIKYEDRNGDLGFALAWWLAQPLDKVPPTPGDLAKIWRDRNRIDAAAIPWRTSKGETLKINEDRARQLRSWAVYLGLGWEHGTDVNKTPHLQPDPTRHLRTVLDRLLPDEDTEVPINELWKQVATRCPFLDGGRYTVALIEAGILSAPQRTLSASVSLALLRLEREGFLRLIEGSDAQAADLYLLTWGRAKKRFSHIARTV